MEESFIKQLPINTSNLYFEKGKFDSDGNIIDGNEYQWVTNFIYINLLNYISMHIDTLKTDTSGRYVCFYDKDFNLLYVRTASSGKHTDGIKYKDGYILEVISYHFSYLLLDPKVKYIRFGVVGEPERVANNTPYYKTKYSPSNVEVTYNSKVEYENDKFLCNLGKPEDIEWQNRLGFQNILRSARRKRGR